MFVFQTSGLWSNGDQSKIKLDMLYYTKEIKKFRTFLLTELHHKYDATVAFRREKGEGKENNSSAWITASVVNRKWNTTLGQQVITYRVQVEQ